VDGICDCLFGDVFLGDAFCVRAVIRQSDVGCQCELASNIGLEELQNRAKVLK
jgi:hypothetical protein